MFTGKIGALTKTAMPKIYTYKFQEVNKMGSKYLEKITDLTHDTLSAECKLNLLMSDSTSLFNSITKDVQSTDKNEDEIIHNILSLKRGYISILGDLSRQLDKLYTLKTLLTAKDNNINQSNFFGIDINSIKAITLEEEDYNNLSTLMDNFYEKGEAEGKAEEQLDEEWVKYVDEFINKKYGVVESQLANEENAHSENVRETEKKSESEQKPSDNGELSIEQYINVSDEAIQLIDDLIENVMCLSKEFLSTAMNLRTIYEENADGLGHHHESIQNLLTLLASEDFDEKLISRLENHLNALEKYKKKIDFQYDF